MIIFILLIDIIFAGDIAALNCPSSFNINVANTTYSDAPNLISRADSLYSAYRTQSNIQRIQNIIVTGNIHDMNAYMQNLQALYYIIGVIFLILFICLAICCIFDTTCPPCKSLKRDFAKRPYMKSQIRLTAISAVIFSGGIVALALISFSSLPNLKDSIINTKCSLYIVLDTAVNGDSSVGWAGFITLANQVSNVSAMLTSTSTTIGNYFGNNNNGWIISQIGNQTLLTYNLYNKYNSSNYSNPNPNSNSPTTSQFISSGLGPIGASNTMVNSIYNALQNTNLVSQAAYSLDEAANALQDAISLIQTNVNYSLNSFNMYNYYLQNTKVDLDYFSNNYIYGNMGYVLYIFEAVVGFILIGALLSIIGIFSTHILNLHICRTMVHLSWYIFGFAYFGVLIMTYIFIPVGNMGYEFCNFYQEMLTNRSQFERFKANYAENVFSKLQACIFDDGNILKPFKIQNQMQTVEYLFTNLSNYQSYTNSSSSNYVNLTRTYETIYNWTLAMANYRDGYYIDFNPYDTSDNNPNIAIQSLNNYTLRSIITGENCTNDNWVFDVRNCSAGQPIYSPSNDNSNGITLTPNTQCISFNTSINSSAPIWSQSDFSKRYNQISSNCSTSFPLIIKYGYSIINFRDSRIDLFQSIIDDLNVILAKNSAYNKKLSQFKTQMTTFGLSTTTLNNITINNLTGITKAQNCTVIKNKLKFTYNSFCINFMSQAIKIGTCMLILCFIMIGAIFLGYMFSIRYSKIYKQTLVEQPEKIQNELQAGDSDLSSEQD